MNDSRPIFNVKQAKTCYAKKASDLESRARFGLDDYT